MPVQQDAPAGEDGPFTNDPEVQKTLSDIMKRNERTDKQVASLARNINATRTDIQGVRREVAELNDNQDVVLQRIDNLLSLIERLLGGQQQGL
jgi:septal ring factor EnvC (AmiA/AmiB activator)